MFANFFSPDHQTIIIHMVLALMAGGVIGLERSYHGRAAGFRTHTLVCLASSMLMAVPLFQADWLGATTAIPEAFKTDPTRMAQGIMTGIGFLGAGVIYKEGVSIRGLTTAASIWITAAVGIMIGTGLYFPALLGAALTFGVLSSFSFVERNMTKNFYVRCQIMFNRAERMDEQELSDYLGTHGFKVGGMSYHAVGNSMFEYRMVIKTRDEQATEKLAHHLSENKRIAEFSLMPSGD